MAKRSGGSAPPPWQVKSVWHKTRDGPQRVLQASQLLLSLAEDNAQSERARPRMPEGRQAEAGGRSVPVCG